MARELTLSTDDHAVLRTERAAVIVTDTIVDLTGPGAIACLQGILTNDVEKVAPDALVWGAVLTPKGMIITDLWVERRGPTARLIVPQGGHEPLLALLTRSFPPRLAKATHRPELAVAWLTGGVPPTLDVVDIAQPTGAAPFTALAFGPADSLADTLADAGFPTAEPDRADALRLLGGWPTLGREIDEKTLPQEVRFDELGGVRYDKGCYVGQETVARLHFRGHANRTLRGVEGKGAWGERVAGEGELGDALRITPVGEEREVGVVSTIGWTPDGWLGVAKIRREVETGAEVMVGGRPARVVALPFGGEG